MRRKSHVSLGKYLLAQYLPDLPMPYQQAFLFGCIEPDRNPATYLKGSFRSQWLRGHNYHNAKRFMARISRRLEHRKTFGLFDYYTLGKLIHYTADAFTFAHNDTFSDRLSDHRKYEIMLQNHFLDYLRKNPIVNIHLAGSVMESIAAFHRNYSGETATIHRDCRYALQACCCVISVLLAPQMI